MSDTKPREFWLVINRETRKLNEMAYEPYTLVSDAEECVRVIEYSKVEEPELGCFEVNQSRIFDTDIHVIEKSAYDKLKTELAAARAETRCASCGETCVNLTAVDLHKENEALRAKLAIADEALESIANAKSLLGPESAISDSHRLSAREALGKIRE